MTDRNLTDEGPDLLAHREVSASSLIEDEPFDADALLAEAGGDRVDYGRTRYPQAAKPTPEQAMSDYYAFDEQDSREFVRVPRQVPVLRIVATTLVGCFVVGIIALGLGGLWVVRQVVPEGDPGEVKIVEVAKGSSVQDIGDQLQDEGVIPNGRVFREFVRLAQEGPFEAGEYSFETNSSVSAAVGVLGDGPIVPAYVNATVPEGLQLSEIAFRLGDQVDQFTADSVSIVADSGQLQSKFQPAEVENLEGLMFPDTYQVEEGETVASVLQRMIDRMEDVTTELGYDQAEARTGYTSYQLITIASMIEREARVKEDQAKIARVIFNRLEQGIPLGIDATVIYAVGQHTEELTLEDLDTDSPYNTRKYKGLPPTPIAAPGRSALEAALLPAAGDWLYYVLADANGGHFFTEDYDAFLRQKEASKAAGLF